MKSACRRTIPSGAWSLRTAMATPRAPELAMSTLSFQDYVRERVLRRRQAEVLAGFDVQWAEALPEGIRGCVFSNEFFE